MTTRAVGAAVASAILAAALVAAWLVPPVAPSVVWPLLLAVPGWVLIAAVAPRIDLAGRIGLAVVLTTGVATHLVHWTSHLAGGYGRAVVFAVAALLALSIPLAMARGVRLVPRGPAIRGAVPALSVAAVAMLVVGVTLAAGLWRVTPEGVVSGGSNWSDLGVHLSIAETLNAGANFPPEVPYFAGEPLVYHWFADFHAAGLAVAAQQFSVSAMVVQSAVMAGALVLLAASLARRLLRTSRARRTAALAGALVVFGGGLGYLRLIGDLTAGVGSPVELISASSYDNQWLTDWPYFRIPSVMGTGLLAHRATTVGLPMLVGAVLLLVAGLPTARMRAAGWRDHRALVLLAGVLGALLAPFHFFFFPAVPLLALAWAVAGKRLLDRAAPANAAAFLVPYLLAIPFAIGPLFQAAGSGALRTVFVWESAPREDGLAAVFFFYLTNLGVPMVLGLAALVAPRLPHRAFFATWIAALFVVPNVVQVSVVAFDMNKYFQAMWIAVAILAAWLVRRWPWPATTLVLVLSVPSPLLVAGWTASSDLQVLTRGELDAARWVRANTPADATFVTDGWVNALTDSAGRKRLTTFGPYVANLGFSPDERIGEVTTIYCGGDPALSAELMRKYRATYVVDGSRPQPCDAPVDFGSSDRFALAYDGAPRIWRLVDP